MWTSSCTGNHSERLRLPDGSGVNREVHAPFCERPGVKLLRPTHPSVSTTITRLYGRAPQGERLVQKVLHGNWKTITFIAALRHDRIAAPFVLEGPMTGEMFKAYTEQFLAPTLKRGDIVFMDNVSVHKVDGIEEAIEARGAIPFYLPAYSPDLNPIEQLFAKLKALLRKVAAYTLKNRAFTVRSLCKTVAWCLDQISRAECAAYLANSGYGQANRTTL